MATAQTAVYSEKEYPSSDGKPLAETPLHRDNLLGVIEMLRRHFAADPTIYISGNMFIYYQEGDGRKHLSPDVFATRGVGNHYRGRYFVWVEGKGPDVVIEMTSESTRDEDLEHKFGLYQDVLRVPEYFLFDPQAEYLDPPLRGFRLSEGRYEPIALVEGRLPSLVLGLHLERDLEDLRLVDPATNRRVPTAKEVEAAFQREVQVLTLQGEAQRRRAEEESRRADDERRRAEEESRRADDERRRAEQSEVALRLAHEEREQLSRELEELRRRLAHE